MNSPPKQLKTKKPKTTKNTKKEDTASSTENTDTSDKETTPPPSPGCPLNAKDKGATCEECPEGMKNNDASLCYTPCDTNYTYTPPLLCTFKPKTLPVGKPPSQCPDGMKNVAGVCWSDCGSNAKDKGLTCEECPGDMVNNGASLCYTPCDTGYKYNGTTGCNYTPKTLPIGVVASQCPNGMKNVAGICWGECGANSKDKGATCETCPPNMSNNGASLCYTPCDTGYTYNGTTGCDWKPVTLTAKGRTSNCPQGYNNFGGVCYNTQCDPGYSYDNQMSCTLQTKSLGHAVSPDSSCPEGRNVKLGGLLCQINSSRHGDIGKYDARKRKRVCPDGYSDNSDLTACWINPGMYKLEACYAKYNCNVSKMLVNTIIKKPKGHVLMDTVLTVML